MRLAILGNAGSGKSTLARGVAQHFAAPCLDLDTVAWEPGSVAVARAAPAAQADVAAFCRAHEAWVVEGCYAPLIAATLPFGPRLVLLNPGVEQCLACLTPSQGSGWSCSSCLKPTRLRWTCSSGFADTRRGHHADSRTRAVMGE